MCDLTAGGGGAGGGNRNKGRDDNLVIRVLDSQSRYLGFKTTDLTPFDPFDKLSKPLLFR